MFLAAVAAAAVYLLRSKRSVTLAPTLGGAGPGGVRLGLGGTGLVGIRGWLLVYMLALAAQLAHGVALTIGSIVIYSKPSLAGLHSFIPLWGLLIYVVSNLALVAYGGALFVLMSRGRKAAIAHNILFNALSITFLVVWFLLSAKSPVGTVADALPGVAAIVYFARSRRVRNTFTSDASRRP